VVQRENGLITCANVNFILLNISVNQLQLTTC
jgi:hypothetical protein